MNYKTDNPVALRSQQWLMNALIELMHEKPYHKITIKEIAQRAELDRSTFYRNFDTKESVLNHYIYKLTEEYIYRLTEIDQLSMDKVINVFINLCMDNLDFFITLRKNGLSNIVLEDFNERLPYVQEVLKSRWKYQINIEYLQYALAFNAGGMWNMLMSWIDDGMKEPYTHLINAFKEISTFNSYK